MRRTIAGVSWHRYSPVRRVSQTRPCACPPALPSPRDSAHIWPMAKFPDKPKKPKDPAHPTRSKAAREHMPPMRPELEQLLNPAIERGEAGIGSGTGLQPPPDNSKDRRADAAAAHKARKSTPQGFDEAPQSGYVGKSPFTSPGSRQRSDGELSRGRGKQEKPAPPAFDAELAAAFGLPKSEDEPDIDAPPPIAGIASQQALDALLREGRKEFRSEDGNTQIWAPHRPPRPEKAEGGQRLVITSDFEPKGDQPAAIAELVEGIKRNDRTQVLLGVTGSGKTFTMAKVIEETQRPALILAPNKTLAAQLYGEFRQFFPAQRGGIFRLVLRLLPAGSLRPAHRHLHRERILDQRADRPHAPFGDARAARTRRRHHRRLGVLHLRHRLGRDLHRDDVHAEAGRAHRPAPA